MPLVIAGSVSPLLMQHGCALLSVPYRMDGRGCVAGALGQVGSSVFVLLSYELGYLLSCFLVVEFVPFVCGRIPIAWRVGMKSPASDAFFSAIRDTLGSGGTAASWGLLVYSAQRSSIQTTLGLLRYLSIFRTCLFVRL